MTKIRRLFVLALITLLMPLAPASAASPKPNVVDLDVLSDEEMAGDGRRADPFLEADPFLVDEEVLIEEERTQPAKMTLGNTKKLKKKKLQWGRKKR